MEGGYYWIALIFTLNILVLFNFNRTNNPKNTENIYIDKKNVEYHISLHNNANISTNITKYQNGKIKEQKHQHTGRDPHKNVYENIIDKNTRDKCSVKPINGSMKRKGGNWVALMGDKVIKYVKKTSKYKKEKNMSITLSPYNGFVNLYAYYDNCHILVFERLKNEFKYKSPSFTILNRTHVYNQLKRIWKVFGKHNIIPSTEIFRGFCCNMWLTTDQQVVFYDFDAYGIEYNHTKIDNVLEHLLYLLDNKYFKN